MLSRRKFVGGAAAAAVFPCPALPTESIVRPSRAYLYGYGPDLFIERATALRELREGERLIAELKSFAITRAAHPGDG